MTDWARLSQPDFDRFVELLIVRSYQRNQPGLTAQAIDGRGGDCGIDIDVHQKDTGKLVKIYQLKFFPEGFSGGHGKRKQQIRRSFERIRDLQPPVWALVLPRNFTTSERKWVLELVQDTGIQLELVGRAELDSLRASDPNAMSAFERTAYKSALELVGRESAALVTSRDLGTEISRLSTNAATLSPNWGVSFSVHGDAVTHSYYAKHPDAVEREPLSIKASLNFADNPDLQRKFDNALRYGLTDQLVLPPTVVKRFERIGPEWFADSHEGGSLTLQPAAGNRQTMPTVLRIKTPEQSGYVLRGTTVQVSNGHEGANILTEFGGGLTIRWRLASDPKKGAAADVAFSPKGHSALTVARSLQALDGLHNGASVELQLGDGKVSLALDSHNQPAVSPAVVELADDLAVIEHVTGTQFGFPDIVDPQERVWARVVRLLLEGECVLAPNMRSLDLEFEGHLDEGLEELLGGSTPVVASVPTWTVEMFNEQVTVGDISYYHPCARVENAEQHLEALRAGPDTSRKGRLVPDDPGVGFRLYLPAKHRHETVSPVRWSLTGIDEHPELRSTELD